MKISTVCATLLTGLLLLGAAPHGDIASKRLTFARPPEDSRIMMRWWWFGPAVTPDELEREMRLMAEGGIGGFEVQPVYPLALDDAGTGTRNLPFLSEDFLDALRSTAGKARELGLRMDLTLGSGWPYGGARVPVGDAAGRLRIERLRIPDGGRRLALPPMETGETLLAVFVCRVLDRAIEEATVRRVEDIRDGALALPAGPGGANEALVFLSSRTGMMVKRPAVGAEGFVLNHYDRAAVGRYLERVGGPLIEALGPDIPHAVFCDSLEVYGSDWTDDFPEEFRRRRGYDLLPHLPALAFDLGPRTAAVRQDWGRTLTELFSDHFMQTVRQWARRHATLFRVQGYGIPPASISAAAHADISEGEGVQWKSVSATRWASSSSHLFGRPVTTSETWTWLHSPVFRATPLDMKAEANLHFLQGVNQLIGHGWPYSPEAAPYPGWRFYAAGVFNENNPWWIVMPDVAAYLQRSSWLLRQGAPANDVAFYLPVSDAYAGFVPGNVNLIEGLRARVGPDAVGAVLDAGYNLDFFDDGVLRQAGGIDGDALLLGPNRYRVVVLPNVRSIPADTYRMLEDFVRAGGRLIACRRWPEAAPGLGAAESDHAEIRRISQSLFAAPSGRSRLVEDEKADLGGALRAMLPPDAAFEPGAPEIGFVHRSDGDADVYFLANTSNRRLSARASFRVAGLRAEWWDPMSGRSSPAAVLAGREGMPSVEVDLEPYEGRFLVFGHEAAGYSGAGYSGAGERAAIDLSAGWRVAFGSTGLTADMERLRSWTDDDATRYYSGVAAYEKTVTVPEAMLAPGLAQRIDFGSGRPLEEEGRSNGMRAWFEGPVREAAVVVVNGRRAGSAWCPPYAVDVTGLLRPGENAIRILAANTAVNHMAGRALPDYRLLNQLYGKRFDPQDMGAIRPIPSGLLGPVRLVAEGP